MTTCPKCGTELKPEMRFCPLCDTEVLPKDDVVEIKFCAHCGAKINPKSAFCSECGLPLKGLVIENVNSRTLQIMAYVVLAIELFCLSLGFLIGLGYAIFSGVGIVYFYVLPMLIPIAIKAIVTYCYSSRVKERKPVNLAFKICIFLLVSPFAGVLMLCDNDGQIKIVKRSE